jgi:hypothetical protein
MHALLLLLAAVPDAGSSFIVTGRFVDEHGVNYRNVDFTLWDTTRLSDESDGDCGTYHPQQNGWTDDGGSFSITVPFQPNRLSYESGLPAWTDPLAREIDVKPGEEVIFNVKTIAHEEVKGRVVDADGAAVSGAHIAASSSRYGSPDSDETGAFSFEVASPASGSVRVRRMGFDPVVADFSALNPVRLAKRRALITITVVDEKTWNPVTGAFVTLTAFKGGERLSFCTAGDMTLTHEARDGECTLDASAGDIELRANDETAWVRVNDASTQWVTLLVKVPPPAVLPQFRR